MLSLTEDSHPDNSTTSIKRRTLFIFGTILASGRDSLFIYDRDGNTRINVVEVRILAEKWVGGAFASNRFPQIGISG